LITLFLQSSLFPSSCKENFSTCKISFRDSKKKYHNKVFDEQLYLVSDQETSKNYLELSSLLIGLKNIKIDVLKSLKEKGLGVKILRIVSKYNNGAYIRNSINQLYDSWEYLDFRGVPHQELWRQVYGILNELKELDIEILIKDS